MARLTAKSFDQRTSDHDALLCECTSKEGAENIILQSIEEFFTGEFLKTTMLNAMPDLKRCLYNTISTHPEYLQLLGRPMYEEDIVIGIVDDLWLFNHLKYEKNIEYNYEVERLVTKSDGYLFGYADLIIEYNVIIKPYFAFGELSFVFGESSEEDISKIWLDVTSISFKKYGTILIELKPNLRDKGAVLRQVKTYRECLPDIKNTVIATFSEVSDARRQLAKNEDVIIVTFKGEIKNPPYNIKQSYTMSQQPATEKQLKFLRELGYTGEVHNRLEASAIIDELKKQQRE